MPHNRVLQLLGHLSAHLHIGYFTFLKKTFENGLLHLCGTHLTKTIFLVHHYFQLLQCLHLQVCLNYPNMMLNGRIELYSPPCRISLSLPSDFVVLCTVQVGKQSAFLNIYIYFFFFKTTIYFWQWGYFMTEAHCILCNSWWANLHFLLSSFVVCNSWTAQQSHVTKSTASPGILSLLIRGEMWLLLLSA